MESKFRKLKTSMDVDSEEARLSDTGNYVSIDRINDLIEMYESLGHAFDAHSAIFTRVKLFDEAKKASNAAEIVRNRALELDGAFRKTENSEFETIASWFDNYEGEHSEERASFMELLTKHELLCEKNQLLSQVPSEIK